MLINERNKPVIKTKNIDNQIDEKNQILWESPQTKLKKKAFHEKPIFTISISFFFSKIQNVVISL